MTFEDCADEPIRTPGSVQPHAALVCADGDRIVVASDNLGAVVGEPSRASASWIGTSLAAAVGDLPLAGPDGRAGNLLRTSLPGGAEVEIHVAPAESGTRTLTAVEIEPTEGQAVAPWPLTEGLARFLTAFRADGTVVEILDRLTAFVAELTGFDRVMAYRFEADAHGVVVAERRAEDLEPFLGLHYPASDIPAQARQLYLDQWLRLIPDASYRPVGLVAGAGPDGSTADLDLGRVACRSVSPVHLEYLANMGVRSSMSVSLVVGGVLWGLIACHHYRGPRRPSGELRQACEFVASAASTLIAARLDEQTTQAQLRTERRLGTLAERLLMSDDLVAGLTGADLLALVEATGAAVVLGDRVASIGRTPTDDQVRRLSRRLAVSGRLASSGTGEGTGSQAGSGIVASDRARDDFGLGDDWDGEVASGVLAVPVSAPQRNFVLWFRPEQRQTVRWAGQPAKAVVRTGDRDRLRPRSSFAEWVESVEGRSVPWERRDVEAAQGLRVLIANHVTRTMEEMARLNAELSRSNAELDAFAYVAAHDLQEPLRGISNYASFLTEDYGHLLEADGREQLESMVVLAGRMARLLRSLLDYSRVGRAELTWSSFRLGDVLADTLMLLEARLSESGASVELDGDAEVWADREMISHVLLNLISNGIKYNDADKPRLRIGTGPLEDTARGADLVPRSILADEAPTVVHVRDNGIGIPPERAEEVFRVFRRLHGPDQYGGGTGAGLTIARRMIERHGGIIWVESEPGRGATFYFVLPERRT